MGKTLDSSLFVDSAISDMIQAYGTSENSINKRFNKIQRI
ncbi:hypothetical protein CGSMWGv75712_06450 [Gardnerella vaginalis 75712]|nr:hypothetical protein CGSMWGv75712_06450 [Gardnerella vaginalis 75712]EIK76416.1 hypothetical protein CGSMWGv284V_00934 [Gardnerella vaginalis 284V]